MMPAAPFGCNWYSGFQKWFFARFSQTKNATSGICGDCTKASENARVTFDPSGSLADLAKSKGAKVGRPAAVNSRISARHPHLRRPASKDLRVATRLVDCGRRS